MSTRILTQEIYKEDCVGDSSAKHNYNLLALDTYLCNLSSKFFTQSNNFLSEFVDFSNNINSFINSYDSFFDVEQYNLANATVQLLSSYWNNFELSVHYPLNISTLGNLNIISPSINTLDNTLISLAKTHLVENYPAYNFTPNTHINVIFFLYNVPVNPTDPNDLISTQTSPEFSYNTRQMSVKMNKQDIHLGNGKILRFSNDGNGKWVYQSTDIGLTDATSQPILYQPPSIRIGIQPPNGRSSVNINISNNTSDIDLLEYAINSGLYYQGYTDVVLTIASGVYVNASSPDSASLIVDGFSSGDTVTIVNNGYIYGAGGAGGLGEGLGISLSNKSNGGNGGDAIQLNFPAEITNNGVIAGGGGGGAGGLASNSDNSWYTGTNSTINPTIYVGSGGGGGGGAGSLFGVAGYTQSYTIPTPVPGLTYNYTIKQAYNGSNGGIKTGGAGGLGYSNGGEGGDLGQAGANTGQLDSKGNQLPPLAGAAGRYLNGKSFATWTNSGIILGNLA